jgi:hypothetical protein
MPVALAAVPISGLVLIFAVLLVVWGIVWVFQKPIASLFNNIPVVGAQVAANIRQVASEVQANAEKWAQESADAIVSFVQVPIKAVTDWLGSATVAVEELVGEIIDLTRRAIDGLAMLTSRVATIAGQVVSIDKLLDAARANISLLFGRVAAILADAIPEAIAALRSWAVARINAVASALETELRKVITALAATIGPAIATALRPVYAAIDALRSALLQAIAVAVRPIQAQLDGLGRAMDQAIAGIRAQLGQLAGLLPLAALLPLVATIVQAIPRFLRKERECWDPACSFLGEVTGGLGNVGQLLTGSALLALVAAAIADPEGTAETVASFDDELRPLASLVTEALAGRSL